MNEFLVRTFAKNFLQCVVEGEVSLQLISVFTAVARRVDFEHVREGDIMVPLQSLPLRQATPPDSHLGRLLQDPSDHNLQALQEAAAKCEIPIVRMELSGERVIKNRHKSKVRQILRIYLARAEMMQRTFARLVQTGLDYGATSIMEQININVSCHGLGEDNFKTRNSNCVGSRIEENMRTRAEDSVATLRSLTLATHLLRLVQFHRGSVCLCPEVEEKVEEVKRQAEEQKRKEEEKERAKEVRLRKYEEWCREVEEKEIEENRKKIKEKEKEMARRINKAFSRWKDQDWEDVKVEVVEETELEGLEKVVWEGECVEDLMKERKRKKKKRRYILPRSRPYKPPLSDWQPIQKSDVDSRIFGEMSGIQTSRCTSRASSILLDFDSLNLKYPRYSYIQDCIIPSKSDSQFGSHALKNALSCDFQDPKIAKLSDSHDFKVPQLSNFSISQPSYSSSLETSKKSASGGLEFPANFSSQSTKIPPDPKNSSSGEFPWPEPSMSLSARPRDPHIAPWVLQPNFMMGNEDEDRCYAQATEKMMSGIQSIFAGQSLSDYLGAKKKRKRKGKQKNKDGKEEEMKGEKEEKQEDVKNKREKVRAAGSDKGMQERAEMAAIPKQKIVKETLQWKLRIKRRMIDGRISKLNRGKIKKMAMVAKQRKKGVKHTMQEMGVKRKRKARELQIQGKEDWQSGFFKEWEEEILHKKRRKAVKRSRDTANNWMKGKPNTRHVGRPIDNMKKKNIQQYHSNKQARGSMIESGMPFLGPGIDDRARWQPGYDFHLNLKTRQPTTIRENCDMVHHCEDSNNWMAVTGLSETGNKSENLLTVCNTVDSSFMIENENMDRISLTTIASLHVTDNKSEDGSGWTTVSSWCVTGNEWVIWEWEEEPDFEELYEGSLCKVSSKDERGHMKTIDERLEVVKSEVREDIKANICSEHERLGREEILAQRHEENELLKEEEKCKKCEKACIEHKHFKNGERIVSLKIVSESGSDSKSNEKRCCKSASRIEEWECRCAGVVDKRTGKPWYGTAQDFHSLVLEEVRRAAEGRQGEDEEEESWRRFLEQQASICVTLQLLSVSHQAHVKVDLGHHSHNSKEWAFVLYNYSRLCGIFETFDLLVSQGDLPPLPPPHQLDFSLLRHDEEWALVWTYVIHWPEVMESAGQGLLEWAGGKAVKGVGFKTGSITRFLSRLAHSTSRYYARHHVLPSDPTLSHLHPLAHARLHLLYALQTIMKAALNLLGINSPPTSM